MKVASLVLHYLTQEILFVNAYRVTWSKSDLLTFCFLLGNHSEALLVNLDRLVNLIRADGPLLCYMYQCRAITLEEKEACNSRLNSYECTRHLLNIVQTKGDWVYKSLVDTWTLIDTSLTPYQILDWSEQS